MYQWKVNPLICCWVIKCSDFLLFTHLIRGNAGKAGFSIVYLLLRTWERSYFCVYVTIIFMFIYGVVFVFFVYYCFHTEKGRDLCVVPVGWPDWILVNWEQKLPTLPQDLPVNPNGIYILHDARTRTNPMSINCANPMSISQGNPMNLWQRNWMLQPLGKFFGPYSWVNLVVPKNWGAYFSAISGQKFDLTTVRDSQSRKSLKVSKGRVQKIKMEI